MSRKKERQDDVLGVIKDFVATLQSVEKAYSEATQTISLCDKATQDYLHELELGSASKKCKTTTALSHNLKKRRACKDTLYTYVALMNWVKKNKSVIKTLQDVAVSISVRKENLKKRIYIPRIISDFETLSSESEMDNDNKEIPS